MFSAKERTAFPKARDTALPERLFSRGWEFDFFQAVWLLERYGGIRVPVGDRGPVGHESFRFRPDIALGFPAADVRRVVQVTDAEVDAPYYQVEVTFMGLYGVSTPLPLHYAVDLLRAVEHSGTPEGLMAESAAPDPAVAGGQETATTPVRDFLDIFHHRLISLFYRSWLKYRYDRAFGIPKRDVITDYLLWLIGCPRGYGVEVLGVPPIRLLRYAGVLTQHPRSATTLEGVLSDYWEDMPIEVQQCVGRWVPVSPADQNSIGLANSTLGSDLTVGEQVYDLCGAFNVTIGPTDWTTYLSFLPGEPRHAETRSFVQLYCADPFWLTVEVCLHAGEVPELRLSSDDRAGRLGLTSWGRTAEVPATSVTFDASSASCRSESAGAANMTALGCPGRAEPRASARAVPRFPGAPRPPNDRAG